MKTLVNCTPTEFFVQTNKIRKSAEKWLKDTNILEIRKRAPQGDFVASQGTSEEEIKSSIEKRKAAWAEQAKKNLFDMIGAVCEDYPKETIELMALVCFIDPKDADNHTMSEYLQCINEIIMDDAVMGFFTSLASLGATNIGTVASR